MSDRPVRKQPPPMRDLKVTPPTKDQSWCDVGECQLCTGYTEDEADPESCMHDCHDDERLRR